MKPVRVIFHLKLKEINVVYLIYFFIYFYHEDDIVYKKYIYF